MAESIPADRSRPRPDLRSPVPIWPRRVVGFPSEPHPLIGREREVAALLALLRQPEHRLVTLVGAGGVGKTRLALAAAAAIEPEFAGGAAFVPLAAIGDPSHMLGAIAQVLETRDTGVRSVLATLVATLKDRRLLLVLDNVEHLTAAAADLAQLLQACPGLTALVTSRAPLQLSNEQRLPIPPLTLPGPDETPPVAALADYGAIVLFVERARRVQPDFSLDADTAPSVVEICRRLDGLPLAIELATAWLRVLSPQALLARLEPRLPLLRGGAADRPARLRTMRDAITWSHDLLTEEERRFFRSLSIFAGDFTLDAAEYLGGEEGGAALRGQKETDDGAAVSVSPVPPSSPLSPPAPSSVLDLLAALIDKSLLQQTRGDGAQPHYTMLETVREFGREQLAVHGEAETIAAAHAAYVVALAEEAASAAGGAGASDWMRRLATERPSVRAALDWLDQTGNAAAALRLTGALWHYWYRLGDLAEGRARLERALATAPPDADPALRARALRGAGVLAWQSADYDRSRERLQAALHAYDVLGDRSGAAWVLNSLGCLYATLSVAEQAESHLTESLAIFHELGDAIGTAQLTANLGELAGIEGRHDLAIERLEAALAMWHALGDRAGAARAQVFLGQALLARDEPGRAETVLAEALATIRDIEYEQILPAALRTSAQLAARRGAIVAAARWYGAEDAVREALGMELTATRRAGLERSIAAVREALGDAAFASAWAAGRGLSAAQAIADALTGLGTSAAAAPVAAAPASAADAILSRRERQVLSLLIDGRSDREIAAALFISRRTASSHVAAILAKLGARSRAEAAVRALRDGLV